MDIHHNKKERNIKKLEITLLMSYFKKVEKILFFAMNSMIHLSTIRHALQNPYPLIMRSKEWMLESKKL